MAIGGGAARFAGIPRRVRELKTSSEVELYVGQELAATGSALVAASALVPDPSAQLRASNLWEGT